MCRTTSVENRVCSVGTESCVPGRSCSWPQAWPRVPTCPGETPAQTRAPTCPGRHQLMQFPHGHATGIVEVGHVQGYGRVRGIHQEVSYHQDGAHLVQPGLPVAVQPGRTVRFTETSPAAPQPRRPAAPLRRAAAPWDHPAYGPGTLSAGRWLCAGPAPSLRKPTPPSPSPSPLPCLSPFFWPIPCLDKHSPHGDSAP